MVMQRSSQSKPTVTLLVERRYLAQAQPGGLSRGLARLGAQVRTLVAEDTAADVSDAASILGTSARETTVVVPRGRSTALLATLRALQARHVAVLHPASAIEAVVDKVGMSARLAQAGVPTPTTWMGHPSQLRRRPDLSYPLILKPIRGDNAVGIAVVHTPAELHQLAWHEDVALAQPFHRGDGHDLKIYVAGPRVWAVRRPSPIHPDGSLTGGDDPGIEMPVTRDMRALAARCRRVFGLVLFGIDCVVDQFGSPLVVDVNEFPNYRGIAGHVDESLARVVLGACCARPRTETGAGTDTQAWRVTA